MTSAPPAAALVVVLPVYLLHALADIDWDFVAASAPVLVAVGVLLAAGRPADRAAEPSRARGWSHAWPGSASSTR